MNMKTVQISSAKRGTEREREKERRAKEMTQETQNVFLLIKHTKIPIMFH